MTEAPAKRTALLITSQRKRRLMVASLRYLDTFVKIDGAWLFALRFLYIDLLVSRALSRNAYQRTGAPEADSTTYTSRRDNN
jgi:hypothetical protein